MTRIRHAAIVSENFLREAKFYEAAFGMKRSKPGSAEEEKAVRTNVDADRRALENVRLRGTGIDRPGMEHIGFRVESVEAVQKELAALRDSNPKMRERIVSEPAEGERASH